MVELGIRSIELPTGKLGLAEFRLGDFHLVERGQLQVGEK
jgi:hypothetical protein